MWELCSCDDQSVLNSLYIYLSTAANTATVAALTAVSVLPALELPVALLAASIVIVAHKLCQAITRLGSVVG
jgi:hypothetical protein